MFVSHFQKRGMQNAGINIEIIASKLELSNSHPINVIRSVLDLFRLVSDLFSSFFFGATQRHLSIY